MFSGDIEIVDYFTFIKEALNGNFIFLRSGITLKLRGKNFAPGGETFKEMFPRNEI